MPVRYVGALRVPRSIAPGRVLMHNHAQHSLDTPCGVNGFRAWTDTEPPPEFVKCPCGWSGLPHYVHHDNVIVTQGSVRSSDRRSYFL